MTKQSSVTKRRMREEKVIGKAFSLNFNVVRKHINESGYFSFFVLQFY